MYMREVITLLVISRIHLISLYKYLQTIYDSHYSIYDMSPLRIYGTRPSMLWLRNSYLQRHRTEHTHTQAQLRPRDTAVIDTTRVACGCAHGVPEHRIITRPRAVGSARS